MVITEIRQVTPEVLTQILSEKGHATAVERVEVVKARVTSHSMIYHLVVAYKQNAAQLPTQLLLKLPEPQFRKHEAEFYGRIVPAMAIKAKHSDLPLVQCYDVTFDEETTHSHVLMEDVSELYFCVDSGLTPSRAHYEQVMSGFAKLHAFWWEHPSLGREIGERLTDERIDHLIEAAQRKLATATNERDWLIPAMRAATSKWPAHRRERVVTGQGVTLVHRDPHPENFLYARHGAAIKIIDWESWRVDTGTDDLAYMMACHWEWWQREQHERDLLKWYYERLVEYGVAGYSFDDLIYDYRASIVRCLFFLTLAWSPEQWKRIGLAVRAFEEWQCEEIL